MLDALVPMHAAATCFMAGVIWYVQLVHYPLFRHVDRARFPVFQRAHEMRTTWIVAPAMTLELVSAVAVTVLGWSQLRRSLLLAGLGLIALIWFSTAFLQVPRHRVLESGFDDSAHRFLVVSNWVRTTAWSARAVIALLLLELP